MNLPASTASTGIVAGCLEACARCEHIARALSPEQYRTKWNTHQGVGPHMRHCVDHFLSLQRDLAAGVVNYDQRDRNPGIEQDPGALLEVLANIYAWLESLNDADLDQRLVVRQIPTVEASAVEVESTLARELLFLASHTIHHITIVNLIAEGIGVRMPEELGMAYSTLAYMKSQA